nr:RCC1-like G exchanging factor-like protein [Onthophagus taurus]
MSKTFPRTFLSLNRYFSTKKSYKRLQNELKTLPIFDYDSSGKDRNRVFVWGNVKSGALGVKYTKQKNLIDTIRVPKRLGFAERHNVISVTSGFGFTIYAVDSKDNLKIYGNGLNTDSQLGLHLNEQKNPLEVIFFPQPISLPIKNDTKILKISAGRGHVAVLTNEGLFLFGNNSYGQCGRKIIENEDYFNSQHINRINKINNERIKDVYCGQDHTIILSETGKVYSCGWGADGQTGLGHYNITYNFTQVNGDIKNEYITKISCRSDFVMALNEKGDVFGWGNTEYGQLITPGNEQQVANPTYIVSTKNLGKIKDVATSGTSCMILNDSGDVFVWGYGILGTGPLVQHSEVPLLIPQTLFGRNDFNPTTEVIKIECGLSHSGVITNSGDLYVWGRNREGCLGLGHLDDQYFPLKVALGGEVKSVSCGLDHTVALCESFLSNKS